MAGYIGPAPVPQATQRTGKIVATEGQTSFPTAGYTPNYIFVWLNGIKLVTVDDYDATNGSDIVLTTGASENDILEYLVFDPFEVAGQTWTGDHTFTGNVNVEGELEVEDDLEVQGDATFTGSLFNINSGTEFPLLNFAQGAIAKSNSDEPAWSKEANFEVATSQPLTVEVDNRVYKIPQDTEVIMPASPVTGNDYAIWIKPDGTLEATEDFEAPPTAGSRRIGGFHYAPGGNAPIFTDWTSNDGGNTTPQINEYSFWDLKWKPSAPDPRGLTLINNAFWVGIYHLVRLHMTGPPHRYNALIAKGGQNPQNPYGGASDFYPDSNWWNLGEVLAYHGFTYMTAQEFQLAAIGVKEKASRGNDPVTTGIATTNTGSSNGDEKFTSKWGCMQMTGVVQQWSAEIRVDDSDQTTSGLLNRGDRNRFGRAAALGRAWPSGSESGSRASGSLDPWDSFTSIGSRGRCGHLILV